MKSLKAIIPVVVLVALVVFYLLRVSADHSRELRDAIYENDLTKVEALLKAHPSLANANNFETGDPRADKRAAGWTPLHLAANSGNVALIQLLTRYHADVNAKDKHGLTPLLWTAFGGQTEAAAALLSNGADVNARGLDGRSTLDLVKLSLDNNMIELLRQRGAKE